MIDQQLLAAYRETTYAVMAGRHKLQLHIDRHDAQLAALLREAGAEQAALLTAWNPGSSLQPHDLNAARHAALVSELEAAGYTCLAGWNLPSDSAAEAARWIEASVLALGLPLEAARRLAGRHGQLAFVWMDLQATPRLIVTAT